MNKQPMRAIIVTRSASLANGLDALLGAISEIDEVRIARTMDDAFEQIESIKPRLILIDAVLVGNQPEELLHKIIARSPETLRVLLVDEAQDVKWMPQYAEAVLLKGVSPSALAASLTHLLFPTGEEHERNDWNE